MSPSEKGKRRVIGLILLIVLIGVVSSVIIYLDYRSTHVITDDAYLEGDVHSISSRIPGKVVEVPVHANQLVEAGEVLFKLDRADLEAELRAATENLALVRNQVKGQRASIEVVNAQIEALKAQQSLFTKEKGRLERLLQKDHVSQDDLDRVTAQWESLNAQITAAENQRKQIEITLGEPDEQGDESAVRLALAQVARIELALEHTAVTSPIKGYVTRKNVTVGQVVGAGQPVMSVVSLEDVYIEANFKETDLTDVKPGQKVIFKVDAYPGTKFEGEVESIMAGTGSAFSLLPAENATGNYIKVVQRIPVRIKITDPKAKERQLRVGMSVAPVILVEEKAAAKPTPAAEKATEAPTPSDGATAAPAEPAPGTTTAPAESGAEEDK